MIFPSANISTKKSFGKPQDLTLLTSQDLSLDNYECCWGLNRGQLDAYRKGPANHLRLQPALKAALNAGRVVILPSDDILQQLLNLQNSNEAVRLEDRRLFFETVPFGTYEYRVILSKRMSRSTPKILSTKRLLLLTQVPSRFPPTYIHSFSWPTEPVSFKNTFPP
ncbi:hypothetical protein BDZ89DRAFT_661074 [Hymenopellis radicata]|nr:hypothetical protein BDZ89DRAFT_661074 [Hymenopellis radicata]